MIPILKHPIKSMKYMRDMAFPVAALAYLVERYEITKDDKLLGAIDFIGEDMKEVIETCYGETDRERMSAMVGSLERELQRIKNTQ